MRGGPAFVPLVLGAGGMLGRAVVQVLDRAFPGTVSATRAEVDVTDRFRLESELERLRPDVVINCAAYTDVDGCETDPGMARRVNVEGAENAASAASAAGCPIVHISTDFVFDGRKSAPYTEEDAPAPLSEYGRSKRAGEERVAAVAADHLIVRTSWSYGAGRAHFVDAIRSRAANGGPLKVVDDQFGSPTYVVDLARALYHLILREARGLVHFANAGICSRHDMAGLILRTCGFHDVPLVPIPTSDAGRIAVRPSYSALDTSRYTRLTGETPRPWQEALIEYLRDGPGAAAGA